VEDCASGGLCEWRDVRVEGCASGGLCCLQQQIYHYVSFCWSKVRIPAVTSPAVLTSNSSVPRRSAGQCCDVLYVVYRPACPVQSILQLSCCSKCESHLTSSVGQVQPYKSLQMINRARSILVSWLLSLLARARVFVLFNNGVHCHCKAVAVQ
jgi:hypothetical protein